MADSNRRTTEIAHVYRGTFFHSTQQTPLQILEDVLLGVDTEGKVGQILKYLQLLVGFRSIKNVFTIYQFPIYDF